MGMRKVMLSFVEHPNDILEVHKLLPDAEVAIKIETEKGMDFVRNYGHLYGQLVAARGDLFIEVIRPHMIIPALKEIINTDPNAIVASRILISMVFDPVPKCSEISDVAMLLKMGYQRFLLGDSVCFHREALLETLNLLQEIFLDYLMYHIEICLCNASYNIILRSTKKIEEMEKSNGGSNADSRN